MKVSARVVLLALLFSLAGCKPPPAPVASAQPDKWQVRYTELYQEALQSFKAPPTNSNVTLVTKNDVTLTGTLLSIAPDMLTLRIGNDERRYTREWLAPQSRAVLLASVAAELSASNSVEAEKRQAEAQEVAEKERAEKAKAEAAKGATTPPPPPPEKTQMERLDEIQAKPMLMSGDEMSARDDILKALLKVSSSTAIGVSHAKYADTLIEANSAIEFSRTKLSAERHKKFLICAGSAMAYYVEAKQEWDSYFEYDWMRKDDVAIMAKWRLEALQKDGVKVDVSTYKETEEGAGMYLVPFRVALTLLWQGADVFVEKMKEDNSAQ